MTGSKDIPLFFLFCPFRSLGGDFLRSFEVASRFWDAKHCKNGYVGRGVRDRVVVEGDVVKYILWGSEIANWNRGNSTLIVDDCGWQTWLTMDRLNNILSQIKMNVYSDRNRLYLRDWEKTEPYIWEGTHTIRLDTRKIVPCNPRVFNQKISNAVKSFHEKGREILEKKNVIATATLDGVIIAFVDKYYSRIMRPALAFKVHSDGFDAYKGMVAMSTIYSAYIKNDATLLLRKLVKEGSEIRKAETILSEVEDFGIRMEDLPEVVVSSLSLAKLMEE